MVMPGLTMTPGRPVWPRDGLGLLSAFPSLVPVGAPVNFRLRTRPRSATARPG